jgi:hypothetical protein
MLSVADDSARAKAGGGRTRLTSQRKTLQVHVIQGNIERRYLEKGWRLSRVEGRTGWGQCLGSSHSPRNTHELHGRFL